jgi:hypothetical protein
MAICNICGDDALRCTCESQQPFCDQCSSDNACAETMDSKCVIYHPDNDQPSKLDNLGMPNGASAEQIFEAIDDLIGNGANVPIDAQDSSTIDLTATGAVNHTIKADLKISPDTNNQLEVRGNGVFAKPYNENYFVKVDANDIPDYLSSQLVGATDGVVSISTSVENGQVKVSPSINLAGMLQAIKNDPVLLTLLCQLIDSCKCFINITNFQVTFSPACGTGYTLNEAGNLCVSLQTTAPTVSSTIVGACSTNYVQYGQYGALVYTAGFTGAGQGIGSSLGADISAGNVVAITTPDVWANNTLAGDNFGPVNRAGVWRCSGTGGSLGFNVPVNVPATKTYYIGIAGDDEFQLTVNGNLIVDTTLVNNTYWNADGGAMFRFWHVYPVTLTTGINYIGLIAIDTGAVQSTLAAEIYDATLVELQNAALSTAFTTNRPAYPITSNVYSNLNLVFTTRCARNPGATFTIGNATCPDSSWQLDTTTGAPLTAPCQSINSNTANWICKKYLTQPFAGYTAVLVWDKISQALNYQVQQKDTGTADSTYADIATVAQPVGTTVTKAVTGLGDVLKDFRVRANYGSCYSDWFSVLQLLE